MGMSAGGKKGIAKPEINVTPLIDVLLVMIIIFMVIKHNNPHRFESKIPEKPPDSPPTNPPPVDVTTLVLSLDLDGKLKINSQDMSSSDQFRSELKKILDQRPTDKRTVFVKAPKQLQYGRIADLIDIAKGAGAMPIGLQIDYLDEK